MAKKSKTQRAKASAARQQRKAEKAEEQLKAAEGAAEGEGAAGEEKKGATTKAASSVESSKKKETSSKTKEIEKKPKKNRFQFFKDVKSEMRRVTWPSKQDVLRWSGVVVVALLFFGIYVAVLDNAIITPLLVFISGFAGA